MRHTSTTEAQQRRQRIDKLYEHFEDVVGLITETDLQDAVLDWMDDADEVPAESILTHIETMLANFETEYEMYATDINGADHFPDDCSDCEHYGIACPVITNRYEKIERDRLRDRLRGAGEDEVKRELRRYAGRNGCEAMIDEIDEWEGDYRDLLERGRELRRETFHYLRPAEEYEYAESELGETNADAMEGRP
ncbi:hypothetical protein Htur_5033 (plasmid) [Haloterrigena turkmenica DSM 5511]|uniref:Uncharacterized protein n=1 Tax=Haloterrigena turkmenica (strain ATCC 51198 / DSM 5511 / JCM 9101 / NCIMB 13204 / VKM B-1734 / 4k) TaxID=543526 RepID=D2S3H4_HALTV|nr:hypothetical protein [Haloterrigena turkmenica]ADB63921.1 hypothetical protein Htur_5033 [Haloterrigena turkmenica DSM 5511]